MSDDGFPWASLGIAAMTSAALSIPGAVVACLAVALISPGSPSFWIQAAVAVVVAVALLACLRIKGPGAKVDAARTTRINFAAVSAAVAGMGLLVTVAILVVAHFAK